MENEKCLSKAAKLLGPLRTRLHRKHPELAAAEFKPLCESFRSWHEVSAFIESCWKDDYWGEARIVFSPEYLHFAFGSLTRQDVGGALHFNGKPVSLLLEKDMAFTLPASDRLLRALIVTGLSTLPGFRGRGFSQLGYLIQAQHAVDSGCALGLGWLDANHNAPGASHSTYGHQDERTEYTYHCHILAKALDMKALKRAGLLRRRERWGAKIVNRIFPARERVHRGSDVSAFQRTDAEACAAFIRAESPGTMKRVLSPTELARLYLFEEGHIRGRAWMLRQGGEIAALAYGYTNPIGGETAYFALDGLLYAPAVGYGLRRRFMAAVESRCRDELGCCAVVAPPTATNCALATLGYAPIARHTLSATRFCDTIRLNETTLGSMLIELR